LNAYIHTSLLYTPNQTSLREERPGEHGQRVPELNLGDQGGHHCVELLRVADWGLRRRYCLLRGEPKWPHENSEQLLVVLVECLGLSVTRMLQSQCCKENAFQTHGLITLNQIQKNFRLH